MSKCSYSDGSGHKDRPGKAQPGFSFFFCKMLLQLVSRFSWGSKNGRIETKVHI